MRLKKATRWWVISVIFIVFLAGYPAPSYAKKVKIEFWNGFTAADGEKMAEMIKQWDIENPDKKVEVSIVVWKTYYAKLSAALAAGRGPDLGILHLWQFAGYASREVLLPLDEWINRMGIKEEEYFPRPWRAGIFEGTRYAIPLDWMSLISLWYNQEHYEAVGLDPGRAPAYKDEFIQYCQKLTRDVDGDGRIDKWGYMVARGTPLPRLFMSILYQNGGSLTNEAHTKATVNEPAGLDACQFLVDCTYKYKISPVDVAVNEENTAFKADKLTHVLHHLAMTGVYGPVMGRNLANAPCPVFGKKPAVFPNSHLLVLPKHRVQDEDKIKATMEFVKWLGDHSYTWTTGGQMPPKKSVVDLPEFKAQLYHRAHLQMAPLLVYPPQYVGLGEIYDRITPALQAALIKDKTPKEALDDLAAEINDILKKK